MNTYTFETNKWYVYDNKDHGKLPAGLYHAVPYVIKFWYDDYTSYVAKCEEMNITPVDNN